MVYRRATVTPRWRAAGPTNPQRRAMAMATPGRVGRAATTATRRHARWDGPSPCLPISRHDWADRLTPGGRSLRFPHVSCSSTCCRYGHGICRSLAWPPSWLFVQSDWLTIHDVCRARTLPPLPPPAPHARYTAALRLRAVERPSAIAAAFSSLQMPGGLLARDTRALRARMHWRTHTRCTHHTRAFSLLYAFATPATLLPRCPRLHTPHSLPATRTTHRTHAPHYALPHSYATRLFSICGQDARSADMAVSYAWDGAVA